MRTIISSFILTILMMVAVPLHAEKVTRNEALQKAMQFMSGKAFGTARSLARATGQDTYEAFYIFNADDSRGFVIVSGDDRTETILGYSDKGRIDTDNMPDNLRYWLEDYARQINSLSEDYRPTSRSKTRGIAKAAIEPMIKTRWHQYEPYCLMCPELDGINCVTGCDPMAIAQIMYYHKWPQSEVSAIPGYTTWRFGIGLEELPPTTFKWDKMKTSYSGDEDEESQMAVAELLRYVGQASGETDYGPACSSSCYYGQLKNNFGYSQDTENWNRQRSQLSNDAWDNVMYEELTKKRPILYFGYPGESAGHAFIVDGFDGNGLFHINWGWGGAFDGFFVLAAADPYMPGTGGTNSENGYKDSQVAILGIEPAMGERVSTVNGLKYNTFPKKSMATAIRDHYSDLKELTVPSHITADGVDYQVKKIDFQAFVEADQLESVTISEGIEYIGTFAFYSKSLTKMEVPSTLKIIDWSAISSSKDLYLITSDTSPKEIIIYKDAVMANTTLVVPDGCQEKYKAIDCWKCVNRMMDLSEYEKMIKEQEEFNNSPVIAFADPKVKEYILNHYREWDVTKDGEISEAEAALVTDREDGISFSGISSFEELRYFTGLTTLPSFFGCESLLSISIPDFITTIPDGAFSDCSSLANIKLPQHLQSIGEFTFGSCKSLTHITIPSSLESIGGLAFHNCTGLTHITIPPKISFIGGSCFSGCNRLTSVTIAGSPTIESYAFQCENLHSVTVTAREPYSIPQYAFTEKDSATLYVPYGSGKKYADAETWKYFMNIVEEDSTTPGDANNDREVNGEDIDAIVRYVMTGDTENFIFKNADINEDNKVDAIDIVMILKMIG